MNYILDKIVGYADRNMELSKYDAAKLRYMLEVIFLNVSELVLFAIIFAFLNKATEFLIAMTVLICIRTFSGGFHLKNYFYCVILSFVIFFSAIMLLPATLDITQGILMEGLLLASVIITIALAPVSKRKSTPKGDLIFKFISTAALILFSIFLLNAKSNPHASICTWIIFIQCTQLIIGRILILRERKAR